MAQNANEVVAEKVNQTEHDLGNKGFEDSLIHRIDFDCVRKASDAGVAAGAFIGKSIVEGDNPLKLLNLPHLDLTGFDQEAPYHSQGMLKDMMHGLKHVVVKDETLASKLESHVESKMTPEERKKFDAENKATDEYHAKYMAWAVSTIIPPPAPPERPNTPMHTEIKERVRQAEAQVTDQVRSKMSPSDLKRLDDQMADYEAKYEKALRITEPDITGGLLRQFDFPSPGNAIKDYYDRIAEATEKKISE